MMLQLPEELRHLAGGARQPSKPCRFSQQAGAMLEWCHSVGLGIANDGLRWQFVATACNSVSAAGQRCLCCCLA
jgi:hypothetical protein